MEELSLDELRVGNARLLGLCSGFGSFVLCVGRECARAVCEHLSVAWITPSKTSTFPNDFDLKTRTLANARGMSEVARQGKSHTILTSGNQICLQTAPPLLPSFGLVLNVEISNVHKKECSLATKIR